MRIKRIKAEPCGMRSQAEPGNEGKRVKAEPGNEGK
jgi:hypothetical protein